MFLRLARGIKFGKKTHQNTNTMTNEELFFSHIQPYAHLQNIGTRIPTAERESETAFLRS
jgi:hypothetical protein